MICKRRFFCSELGLGPDSSEISDKGDSLPDPRSDVLKKNWDDLTDDDFAAIASCGYILEDHVKLPFDRENDYESVYIFKARTTKEDLTGRIRISLPTVRSETSSESRDSCRSRTAPGSNSTRRTAPSR